MAKVNDYLTESSRGGTLTAVFLISKIKYLKGDGMAYDRGKLTELVMRITTRRLRFANLEKIQAPELILNKERELIAQSQAELNEFVVRHSVDLGDIERLKKQCEFFVRRDKEIDDAYWSMPIAGTLMELEHSFLDICYNFLERAGRYEEWMHRDQASSEKILEEVVPGSPKVLHLIYEVQMEIARHLGLLIDQKPKPRF